MFFWYGPFTWLVFFLVIGGAVYLFIKYEITITGAKRSEKDSDRGELHGESPLEILEKRLARGEITIEEFEKIKKDIEK